MAQLVMARNPLTHRSCPYRKNGGGSSDSNVEGLARLASGGLKRPKAGVEGVMMGVHLHEEDLPSGVRFADGPIAVDTEAMGLVPGRDRLCLVQLSDGKGDEHLVRFKGGSDYGAPNLKALLGDTDRLKLYHFARFDVGIIQAYLGITA